MNSAKGRSAKVFPYKKQINYLNLDQNRPKKSFTFQTGWHVPKLSREISLQNKNYDVKIGKQNPRK